MLNGSLLLTALLGFSPGSYAPPPEPEPICVAAPPAPERLDAQPFASMAADGARSWGATASYRLSSGELGEAFMVLDDAGSGEAQLMVDGEIIAHVSVALDHSGNPVITQWMPEGASATPEVLAEMMGVDLPGIVADSIPQEFKCSPWGRKVLKAGKYLATGVLAGVGAACCSLTATLACPLCVGGAAMGTLGVHEFADGYCE